MFELRNISKSFGKSKILDDVSLSIPAGKTIVMLGPSGCGKSTLIRILIGLIYPDVGSVHFAGAPIRPETIQEQRRRMGYVIQDGGLFPHLTSSQNVTVMARHLGWSYDRMDTRLAELTQLVKLSPETLARYPAETSGGQRQRVGLMRALMLDPEALLLDEPLGALDPITRSDLQKDLRSAFQKLQKTVVLVTHDLAEAAYFADHVVLLEQGRIAQQGSLQAMVQQPASPFVSEFVASQRAPWEALQEAMA